jgi:enoyl-CoA hydratase/carnithine racemase
LYSQEGRLSTTHALYETDGPIAALTFNRPEARNAMTWDMYQALVEACDRVDDDPAIRVLVLKGAGGKAFVAGTDIAQFESFRGPDDGIAYEQRIDQVLDRLERVTKATIAQVHGVAAGGGCAIALTCDLRIATPESSFGIPVARTLGNCLSGASYSRLVDLLGPALVKDMLLTGRFVPAAEALTVGMVNRVEPADGIDRIVHEYASRIASNAPLTVRATKEMIGRIMAARRLPAGQDHDVVTMCYTSRDFREGIAAFRAKRPPTWTGS